MNGYELSRKWFDFSFENPEKIKPNHAALYFFIIEHCNRLGWKDKFGLPTTMAMEAIGIKSYNTYKNTLFELVEFGFIKMVETSKNQYSSNIVALSNFNKALDKALDKALLKHTSKQSESTHQSTSESIDSIDKPLTINNKPIEQINNEQISLILSFFNFSIDNPNHIKQQRLVLAFINSLKDQDYFFNQFESYRKLKEKEPEYKHSLNSFIGNQSNVFEDGKWQDNNWVEKLKTYKPKKQIEEQPHFSLAEKNRAKRLAQQPNQNI